MNLNATSCHRFNATLDAAQPDAVFALSTSTRANRGRTTSARWSTASTRRSRRPTPANLDAAAARLALRRARQPRPRHHRYVALQPDRSHHRIQRPDRSPTSLIAGLELGQDTNDTQNYTRNIPGNQQLFSRGVARVSGGTPRRATCRRSPATACRRAPPTSRRTSTTRCRSANRGRRSPACATTATTRASPTRSTCRRRPASASASPACARASSGSPPIRSPITSRTARRSIRRWRR